MKTVIFRNNEELETREVLSIFREKLEENTNFEMSEIEELVEEYAKNPVDKFIITDGVTETFQRQGDILIWAEGSEMYEQEFPHVKLGKRTNRTVLQKGDSMTGDHRFIPVSNSRVSICEGTFVPSFLQGKAFFINTYDCIILKTNKPFLIVHREHGNMALPAGKYMVCSQMDANSLTRMLD